MPSAKEKELKPWDRRPWPANGDDSIRLTYESVGRTLSAWESHESALSLLFANFVGSRETRAAKRAYCAVRTFEGRAEMLKAASKAYFETYPDKPLYAKFSEIYKQAKEYASRRNDIAHGVVGHFYSQPFPMYAIESSSYALYPSYANFKDRDINEVPAYCYTSVELDYFYEQFFKLIEPVRFICGTLQQKETERSLMKKLRQQDHK